ncbi:MAG: ABC transporter substrate-binding protein [Beijerinckiaceae bacterium]
MSTSRRTFLGASIGAIAASQGLPARSQNSPIRIGCITTLSGAAGILGKPQHQGMLLAAKRINESGGILGRQIEIIVRDDQSKPDVAVAAVRELAGSGVRIFAGVLASPVALAISGIAEELDSVFLNAASHGNNLTHENFRKNYFRLTDYSAMRISAGSRLMAERYSDVAKWGAIIPDAEIGRSTMATFRFAMPKYYMQLHKKAVTVNDPVVVKFGATDYRNAISTLLSSDIDGIFVGLGGGDEVGFLQQAGQLGLSKRIKVYVTSGSDFQAAKALGKRTPENYWSGHHWYFGAYAGNPISDALYKQYVAETNDKFPDGFIGMGHTAVSAVAAAAAKAGDLSTKAMIGALEGLSFDTVKGKVTIRPEDHQAICDVNYVKLAPDQSEAGWTIADYYKADGAELAGPPTPGKEIEFK